MIQFWLEVGDANGELGHPLTREVVRSITLAAWPRRTVNHVEMRVIATSLAYAGNIRLAASGTKDTRMEAAMLVAGHLEGLESGDIAETVRKSIQRFRAKARRETVFYLDPDTLEISYLDAEAALLSGLPGKPGRPKKPSGQTD